MRGVRGWAGGAVLLLGACGGQTDGGSSPTAGDDAAWETVVERAVTEHAAATLALEAEVRPDVVALCEGLGVGAAPDVSLGALCEELSTAVAQVQAQGATAVVSGAPTCSPPAALEPPCASDCSDEPVPGSCAEACEALALTHLACDAATLSVEADAPLAAFETYLPALLVAAERYRALQDACGVLVDVLDAAAAALGDGTLVATTVDSCARLGELGSCFGVSTAPGWE